MHKLVILFRQPPDVMQFEEDWSSKFMPLAEAMDGIRRVQVGQVTGSPEGESKFYKMHEFYFDDLKSLYAALESPKGQMAGRALVKIAGDIASVYFVEVNEDDRELPRHEKLLDAQKAMREKLRERLTAEQKAALAAAEPDEDDGAAA